MSKSEQVLILDPPHELHFKGPFNEVTTAYLKLTNPTEMTIAFKVKTTAPKTYCVRPNGGIVLAKKTVTINVMLQPFDPENDDRSKDKFMVQSMILSPEETYASDVTWQEASPDSKMNSKLKCVFHLPNEAANVPHTQPIQQARNSTQVTLAEVVDAPKAKAEIVHVQEPKPIENEAEIRRLREEHKKLRSELSELRQENSSLKEEGIRYRLSRPKESTAGRSEPTPSNTSQSKQQVSFRFITAILIVVLLIGVLIGKAMQ